MDAFEERFAAALKATAPDPPDDIDAGHIIRRVRPHRRAVIIAPIAAAVVVLLVTVGVVALVIRHRTGPGVAAEKPSIVRSVPPPPRGFASTEFALASTAGAMDMGPPPIPGPSCRPDQISAHAATRPTSGGVLGVVHVRGMQTWKQHGKSLQCSLPVVGGPSRLVTATGRQLPVRRSRGDTTSPPNSERPDIALNDGDAILGFAWYGSYCGPPPSAVMLRLRHGAVLRVPLSGPHPRCGTGGSRLIDGIVGAPGEPVQPPRPDYSSLRLTGHIEPGTTPDRLAPASVELRTIGDAPVPLDPCPAYSSFVLDRGSHGRRFGRTSASGSLPCTDRTPVVRPGHPLRFRVHPSRLGSVPASTPAPGEVLSLQLTIAGVPSVTLHTTVR